MRTQLFAIRHAPWSASNCVSFGHRYLEPWAVRAIAQGLSTLAQHTSAPSAQVVHSPCQSAANYLLEQFCSICINLPPPRGIPVRRSGPNIELLLYTGQLGTRKEKNPLNRALVIPFFWQEAQVSGPESSVWRYVRNGADLRRSRYSIDEP